MTEINHAVTKISPNTIEVEFNDESDVKELGLSIGAYIAITSDDGSNEQVVGIIQNYKSHYLPPATNGVESDPKKRVSIIEIQPLGCLTENGFERGLRNIKIPPKGFKKLGKQEIEKIYAFDEKEKAARFSFSKLSQNDSIEVPVNGDLFFGKHIAVVGSTGSGKSCTVASILQKALETDKTLNNAHIVIFDLHGEYKSAFETDNQKYKFKYLSVDDLKLPFWLSEGEELEGLFEIKSTSSNQVSDFKQIVTSLKKTKKANSHYDSPVQIDLKDLLESDAPSSWTKTNGFKKFREAHSTACSRIESLISDERFKFIFNTEINEENIAEVFCQITGFREQSQENDKANVTVIDLSGIPFEVLNLVVANISKLLFKFCFHYKKLDIKDKKELPFLLVYEEAHNYIPSTNKDDEAKYKHVKKAVERIAKEGRKYGISLMVVSQRPSEISESIFSQCNNFVVMRLTNNKDQGFITKLLPDELNGITNILPILKQREALIVGDSITLPSLVMIDPCDPKPKSEDVKVYQEWRNEWVDLEIQQLLNGMYKL